MARAPTTFRQRDVSAAIKAAKVAGCEVSRVEIGKDGKIVIITGPPAPPDDAEPCEQKNPWDKVLSDEH